MTGKNTMKLPVILAVMVLLSLFAVLPTLAEGDVVSEVERAIGDAGAVWTAGETSVSGYSLEDKLGLCGAKIGPLPADAVILTPPADRRVSYGTFDWRNVGGEDWMTSVKEQGPCGSCWVFCATGAFEAQINIDAGDPTIDFDSSEQNILSCSGGGDCEEGGWVNATLEYIRDIGVPDEGCFRYRANDSISCNDTCSDWQDRAWTCERIGVPVCHRTECYKWILEDYGPMVVVLNVSEDLFYYTGGI
ncbi:MAG: C1 family peptidase, partial [Euryarchaeota archaeon]|nr:C1 family peptidase [Euryarchaeota archaeon]